MKDRLLAKINLHRIEDPISTNQLCGELEIDEGRLRIMVHELRMQDHKIGSKDLEGKYGYFMARDKTEMQPTLADIRSRAFSLLELLNHMENWNEPEPKLF